MFRLCPLALVALLVCVCVRPTAAGDAWLRSPYWTADSGRADERELTDADGEIDGVGERVFGMLQQIADGGRSNERKKKKSMDVDVGDGLHGVLQTWCHHTRGSNCNWEKETKRCKCESAHSVVESAHSVVESAQQVGTTMKHVAESGLKMVRGEYNAVEKKVAHAGLAHSLHELSSRHSKIRALIDRLKHIAHGIDIDWDDVLNVLLEDDVLDADLDDIWMAVRDLL